MLIGDAGADAFRRRGHPPPPNVTFAGRVTDPELRGLLEGALAFLCPSTTEGFGLPPLEAMALGTPAIVAPEGALPEVCADAALYADARDPAPWAARLRRLADDAGAPRRLQPPRPRPGRPLHLARRRTSAARGNRRASANPTGTPPMTGAPWTRVAVVVASTGRPDCLAQLSRRLAMQSRPPHRVVFSVVAPSDLPARQALYPDAIVVIGAPGLPRQRNRGLELVLADSDAVAFLDDDYVPSRHALVEIGRFFRSNPGHVGVNGHLIADGINSAGIAFEDAERLVDAWDLAPRPSAPSLHDLQGLYGCNMAFRTAAIGAHPLRRAPAALRLAGGHRLLRPPARPRPPRPDRRLRRRPLRRQGRARERPPPRLRPGREPALPRAEGHDAARPVAAPDRPQPRRQPRPLAAPGALGRPPRPRPRQLARPRPRASAARSPPSTSCSSDR